MFQLPQRQKITAILEVIIIMIIWKLLIGTQGKKEMRKAYVGTFVSRKLIVYLTKKTHFIYVSYKMLLLKNDLSIVYYKQIQMFK